MTENELAAILSLDAYTDDAYTDYDIEDLVVNIHLCWERRETEMMTSALIALVNVMRQEITVK